MARIRLDDPPKRARLDDPPKRARLHPVDFIMGPEGSETSRAIARDGYNKMRVRMAKLQGEEVCIACGGTGVNSRGDPCYPCEVRKRGKK